MVYLIKQTDQMDIAKAVEIAIIRTADLERMQRESMVEQEVMELRELLSNYGENKQRVI